MRECGTRVLMLHLLALLRLFSHIIGLFCNILGLFSHTFGVQCMAGVWDQCSDRIGHVLHLHNAVYVYLYIEV